MEVAQIKGRKRCWVDGDMMAVGGPCKRTDSGVTDKMGGVRQGWKWRQKTDRCRRALEDDNNDGNEAYKGRKEVVEIGGRETAESIMRSGLLHRPPPGIRLPSRPIRLRSEAEGREVTVLVS